MRDQELMHMIDNSQNTAVTAADIGIDVRLAREKLAQALWMLEAVADMVHLVDDPRMTDAGADVLVAMQRLTQAIHALDSTAAVLPAKRPRG